VPPRSRSIDDCGLCVHGFMHMVLLHDHATIPLVTTRDGVMRCDWFSARVGDSLVSGASKSGTSGPI